MTDNHITIAGTVGRDPELRYTPSGATVASFGVAVNRRWKRGDEWQEETSWFDVKCWKQMAENVAESIHRGTRVIVTGRLEQRSWETDNGEKRSKVEIIADEIAPSLRWATAQVHKIEREQASRPSGGNAKPAATYSADEEPFTRGAEVVDL